MQLVARLVHAEPERRVVLVSAMEGERTLASALGEASHAEEAEDRARQRLLNRLAADPAAAAAAAPPVQAAPPAPPPPTPTPPPPPPPEQERPRQEPTRRLRQPPASAGGISPDSPGPESPGPDSRGPESPGTAGAPGGEGAEPPPLDPEDWSAELAQLDLQLQRRGWARDQEARYLERAFGHPSRNRLTTYADLIAYLRALEGFEPGQDPGQAAVPLRRRDLLAQSDLLLEQLGWEADRGRSFLEEQLGASSRSQLSDPQLLQFNMLLEGELLDGQGDGGRMRALEESSFPQGPHR